MLDKPDTDVVRDWLKLALAGDDAKGRRAALAHHCGVRPQAVSGWLRTGRITKKNLELAAAFFGHGPSFTKAGHPAREPPRHSGYDSLPPGLTSDERDLVTSFRVLPRRKQVLELAHIMQEAAQHTADMAEHMQRLGAKGTVSAQRAAEVLPIRPDGPQPDTVPGALD